MKISKEKSLAEATTFRVGGAAKFFCSAKSKEDLQEALDFAAKNKLPLFILGGGSNVLAPDGGFDGLVMKIEIKGIEEVESLSVGRRTKVEIRGVDENNGEKWRQSVAEPRTMMPLEPLLSNEERFTLVKRLEKEDAAVKREPDRVFVRAGAGENWDDFVAWCVERGYGGLENLSFIPGTVGAAPVQNVGAYGVEVGDLIESVEAFDAKEETYRFFSPYDCRFSYRDSIFKREKGRYAIVSVTFKLKKGGETDISYRDLKEYFDKKEKRKKEKKENDERVISGSNLSIPGHSISEVRDAVIAIRTAKLPDIRKVGTAGSFFKNPIVSKQKYAKLKEAYPGLPSFPQADNRVKIPLAWIIDHICGMKGKRFGKAGIHDTQALVIVNYGGATSKDVEKAAAEVEKAVKEKTGIEIEREVVMV